MSSFWLCPMDHFVMLYKGLASLLIISSYSFWLLSYFFIVHCEINYLWVIYQSLVLEVGLLFEPHLPSTSFTCFCPCFFSCNIDIYELLLSQHSNHPDLSPRDAYRWYPSGYTLHWNKVWSMLWVQTFVTITNLLLVLSESICQAIHCKHHSWFTSTTWIFLLPSDFCSPLQGEPYMDSLHLYMDPLHPLVYKIFNKFVGSMLPTEVPQPLQ